MKVKFYSRLTALQSDESGATAIEYALVGSLISIAIIGSVVAINGSMIDIYDHIRGFIVPALEGASSPDAG